MRKITSDGSLKKWSGDAKPSTPKSAEFKGDGRKPVMRRDGDNDGDRRRDRDRDGK